MRIVFDARAIGPQPDGIGRYSECLLKELARLDSTNHWTVISARPLFEFRDSPKFRERVIPYRYIHPWTIYGMPRILEEEQADLLFSPFFFATPRFSGRTVLTVHDLMWVLHPALQARSASPADWVKAQAHRYFVPLSIRRAHGMLVPSRTTADELEQHFGVSRERIVVTPLGLDHLDFSARVTPLDRRDDALLFLGSSKPYKNMQGAIAGFAAWLRRHPYSATELRIVGRSDVFAPQIRAQVELARLGSRIRFLGPVLDGELKRQLGCVRALLFPSLHEGFGFPPLEAMGYGTPVISSLAGALAERLDGRVIPVDPSSIESIADGIDALGDVRATQALVDRGLEYCRLFLWKDTARRTLELLESTGMAFGGRGLPG